MGIGTMYLAQDIYEFGGSESLSNYYYSVVTNFKIGGSTDRLSFYWSGKVNWSQIDIGKEQQ